MIHTRSAGAKSHRDRKNGASREEWQTRKAERNAERGKQIWYEEKWVLVRHLPAKCIGVRE